MTGHLGGRVGTIGLLSTGADQPAALTGWDVARGARAARWHVPRDTGQGDAPTSASEAWCAAAPARATPLPHIWRQPRIMGREWAWHALQAGSH